MQVVIHRHIEELNVDIQITAESAIEAIEQLSQAMEGIVQSYKDWYVKWMTKFKEVK